MRDHSSALLLQAICSDDRPALWVIDEDTDVAPLAAARARGLRVMTNRYDQFLAAKAAGIEAVLADYQLAAVEPLPPVIAHRVAKQKAPVHHLVNQVAQYAGAGTELWLAGAKNEGIKTYIAKAGAVLDGRPMVSRGSGGAQCARIACGPGRGLLLPDDNYSALRVAVREGELAFLSKPGIYGWCKIDTGSQLLASQLPAIASKVRAVGGGQPAVLDLGCGYGYLAVKAALAQRVAVTATDSNLAAVAACRANFERYGVEGEVVLDDAASGIHRRFDLVLCNPPFHQGFAASGGQTDKFVAATAAHLQPQGLALFVVNRFIPLPRTALQSALHCEQLVEEAGFRVYVLRHQART